jgi:hypothetical protein
LQLNCDGTLNSIQPLAYVANQGMNDVFTFREAMQQEESAEFIKVMVKEIQDHTEQGHWCLRCWCELGNINTILKAVLFLKEAGWYTHQAQGKALCLQQNSSV